jgi:hypothetical protein
MAEMSKTDHWQSALAGIALALIAYVAISIGWYQWTSLAPASRWFEVQSLFIADAVEGGDPVVTYTRVIKEDIHAEFTVSITRHEGAEDRTGTVYCTGEGSANYVAGRELPPAGTSLAWLMNREGSPCVFLPGIYRARGVWQLSPPGYPVKQITVDSNYFTVHPAK